MRPAACLVAVAVIAAGCFGSQRDDPAPDPEVFSGPAPDPDILDRARDSRPHIHDYWNGSKTMLLFERPANITGSGDRFWSSFNPPLDAMVVAGTGSFRVLASWNASNGKEVGAHFYYTPPGGKEQFVRVPNGEAVTIPIDPAWHDAPHSHKSKWRYGFGGGPQPGAEPVTLRGQLRVEILRGMGPIPISPAHPEHWNGTTAMKVGEFKGRLQDAFGFSFFVPRETPPYNPKIRIVPPETKELLIVFSYNSSTPASVHYAPTLSWTGADNFGYESRAMPPTQAAPNSQNGKFVWKIAAAQRMWDSPYVTTSDWFFNFDWSGNLVEGRGYYLPRPSTMVGDYHLIFEVHRAPQPS